MTEDEDPGGHHRNRICVRLCWEGECKEIIESKSPGIDVEHEHARPNKCCF